MLGHKSNMPAIAMGHKNGAPIKTLGHKMQFNQKNYLHGVKPESIKKSPVEKVLKGPNALGQYA